MKFVTVSGGLQEEFWTSQFRPMTKMAAISKMAAKNLHSCLVD